jgi:prepilin-type N-terminal cleavage/methylation domain-containing protein
MHSSPRDLLELNDPSRPQQSTRAKGFTLVELLVVVAVIVVMMRLAIPAFNAIHGGTDFTSEVYDIAGTFEQARSYAMANNTYVLAGIFEAPAGLSSSANPQTSGTGRITIAVVASQTGTRPYDVTNLGAWSSQYGTGLLTTNTSGGFMTTNKPMQYQNIHLVDLQTPVAPPSSGNMARPAQPFQASNYVYDIPNANCVAANQFEWPLGAILNSGQYVFTKVIEFDPQGTARVINTTYQDAIPEYIEIGLQPSHGSMAPPVSSNQNTGQIAAIQIDGMSGAIHTYRP